MQNPRITIAGRTFSLPASRLVRMAIGIVFVIGGLFGFLPILGFWMIPVGLIILSVDIPYIRRRRRRVEVWWTKRRRAKAAKKLPSP